MIDRDEVMKSIECCLRPGNTNLCGECSYKDVPFDCKHALIKDVHELLKEQEAVEPKTGHWIYLQYCANEGVYCSECHTKMFDRYPMKKKLSQFCGHCGAKMEGRVMLR